MSRLSLVRNLLNVFFAVVALLCVCVCAAAQQQQDTPLSADEIISILQQNPNLLAAAKEQIASQGRDRGYPIRPSDISDDRLFSEINSDDRVRVAIGDELKKRGYGASESEQQEQPQQPGTARSPVQGTPPAGNVDESGSRRPTERQSVINPPTQRQEQTAERRSPGSKAYPYRNLPALKDLYAQAVVPPEKLERFGESLFRNPVGDIKIAQDVSISSDYVVGPGDELVVQYWGAEPRRLSLTVDREGRLLLPEGSVFVSGLSLAGAQRTIQERLKHIYKESEVDVSLGKLRTVHVYIVGDVEHPGAYEVSPLATALSALIAAGGPTDNGSLRTVKHFRDNKLIEEVDLYDLMLKGVTSSHVRMQSGDSILVPTVGPQVTVEGSVRRPAIYELRNNETTLDQVINLAGGIPVTGALSDVKVERVQAHERKVMMSLGIPSQDDPKDAIDAFNRFVVKDGDVVTVAPILPYTNQVVYLQGHVFRPGKYPYKNGMKVTDLIGSFNDMMPEPADRAEIVRLRPPDYRPEVIGFNLRDVLDKKADAPELEPFDTIRTYGRYEADGPKVQIHGEVLHPGEYPLSEAMSAADLVRMAGGFRRDAYRVAADLASYSADQDQADIDEREIPIGEALKGVPDTDVRLKPGDVLTVRRLGGWDDIGGVITVEGQVLHPGQYAIRKGEKLSSVIKRAGGFIGDAYPNGAVLDRAQVREISARNRDELIQTLQSQALEGDPRTENPAARHQRQQLIDQLKQVQPNGRLVIHITSNIAKWQGTSADIDVRKGDMLTIPKKPNFVLIAGQVYSPTAVTWTPGRSAEWYLRQAGGPTKTANKKDILVVRANGSVIGGGSHSWISGGVLNTVLQPGDAVYVPEKNAGPSRSRLATLTQLAPLLSGAAVAAGVAATQF